MYKNKSSGLRTDPGGTPYLNLSKSRKSPSIKTYCIVFAR